MPFIEPSRVSNGTIQRLAEDCVIRLVLLPPPVYLIPLSTAVLILHPGGGLVMRTEQCQDHRIKKNARNAKWAYFVIHGSFIFEYPTRVSTGPIRLEPVRL